MQAVSDGVLPWVIDSGRRFGFEIGNLIIILALLFGALALFLLIRGIAGIISEKAAIRRDAAALISGELMPSEKRRRMRQIKKHSGGLRQKLIITTLVLVFIVNTLTSIPVFILVERNQRETLASNLSDRMAVMMQALVSSAAMNLSHGNIEDMGALLDRLAFIPEGLYITITGYNPQTLVFEDQVWASNDPALLDKIDTPGLIRGYSRLGDYLSLNLLATRDELNSLAQERVGGYPENIISLNLEITELAGLLYYYDSGEIASRLEGLQVSLGILERRLMETLKQISPGMRSFPEFTMENIQDNRAFIFYQPVLTRLGGEDSFFWGLVRFEVSVRSILDEIASARNALLELNLLIAILAQIFGAVGALFLSSYMLKPVRKLVTHVETIRDTQDKAMLIGFDVELESKDELAILGNTINDMTRDLVKAALAASELTIAKEFQKKFLPLETDVKGNKLTSGFDETAYINIFAYYEGAKEVSGDYFDYQDLDGRYYAIIKCDVAGKGVPASFIMIQVATMFLDYCRQWKPTVKGMRIEELVYRINEFIENLSFSDRFVAFTFCLYDSLTGTARFCNAGDNIIHLFDASEKKIKTLFLPQTPAAGVLPTSAVDSKGGYTIQTLVLDHGDMLLLYTDGIDESVRKFRDNKFEEILCEEGPVNTPHENHLCGQAVEELGSERMTNIINSVMNRKIYTLRKWHNGEGEGASLQFDFRACEGTVEEVIMAIISVEKVFRMFYNPTATAEDEVPVDKIVDVFLKKHFVQYQNYCSFSYESPVNPAYMYYTHVMEDEQNDDLTILGIKRK